MNSGKKKEKKRLYKKTPMSPMKVFCKPVVYTVEGRDKFYT